MGARAVGCQSRRNHRRHRRPVCGHRLAPPAPALEPCSIKQQEMGCFFKCPCIMIKGIPGPKRRLKVLCSRYGVRRISWE